jgi:hypothetical protein
VGKLKRVVNVFVAEKQDILPDIPDSLRRKRMFQTITRNSDNIRSCEKTSKERECSKCHRKDILLWCATPKVKIMANQEDEYVFTVKEKLGTGKVTVCVGGVPLEIHVDSGASTNFIDKHLWEFLEKKHIKCTLRKTTKELYAYGSTTPRTIIGTFTADVNITDKHVPT